MITDQGIRPLVEIFAHALFESWSAGRGRRRKHPKTVELMGKRGEGKMYQVKGNKLPPGLEGSADEVPGATDYNGVLENVRAETERAKLRKRAAQNLRAEKLVGNRTLLTWAYDASDFFPRGDRYPLK